MRAASERCTLPKGEKQFKLYQTSHQKSPRPEGSGTFFFLSARRKELSTQNPVKIGLENEEKNQNILM